MSTSYPKGWNILPLSEVSTLQRGYDLPVKKRIEGTYPVFAANGPIGTHNEAKVSGPGVVTGRSGTIGKVHYVDVDYWPLNTSLYVKDFHGNHPRFVYYLLSNMHLERFHAGTGVPTLNRNNVHGVPIPLPPLPEQKRIATILDAVDALRAKRRESIEQLDSLIQSTFLEMFGDPVTNPKGWEISSIRNVAELENGDRSSNYPSGNDLVTSGILFLSTKNISNNRLLLDNLQWITEEKFKALSRGKLKPSDIVITLRGTLGSCAIFESTYTTGFINAQLMIIRPKQANPVYLHGFLSSKQIQEIFQREATGGTVKQLTSKQIGGLPVPLPPLDLQTRFASIVESIEQQKTRLKAHLAELDTLFASLQSRAFNGELVA